MEEKHNITIFINGKPRSAQSSEPARLEEKAGQAETAAALIEYRKSSMSLTSKVKILSKRRNPLQDLLRKKHDPIWQARPFWKKKLVMSVAGAVLTGMLFGAAVLMVFSSPVTESAAGAPVSASVETNKKSAAALSDISLSFAVVQAGVFSSEDRAEKRAGEIKNSGVAASVMKLEGNKYAILSGIGNEKHQAASLVTFYEEKGIDVWEKNHEFSYSSLHSANKLDESYFVNGKTLLQNVVTLSFLPAGENRAKAVASTLREYEKWRTFGVKQRKEWSSATAKQSKVFEKNMAEMLELVKQEKDQKKIQSGFQQEALNALVNYDKLMKSLKKEA
ncbi:hypothetical protein ACFQPF_06165 [Fictibacillus iocasae]|uniref:SPOR domain-containing protein n=1 Tax=Fictibacillus iocasae TaxID=2715437 RepID=A0ABW2NLC2_9BACL